MKKILIAAVFAASLLPVFSSGAIPAEEKPVTVAVYYFGNYHPNDNRNQKIKGPGWTEWELVKAARPRFPGHQVPHAPLWGYTDESKPEVMAQKIDAAADHGIDAFIFDWYHYDDGPYLERSLDDGFLHAPNKARLKFALMWANHDWQEIQPYRRGTEMKTLFPGKVTPESFRAICAKVIEKYFKDPGYWLIDGRPYFSFYDLSNLLANFGSVAKTREALDEFRAQVKAAGFPGLHLNVVAWGQPVLPAVKEPLEMPKLVHDLGFDSVTSYVWVQHFQLPTMQTDYDVARDGYLQYWTKADTEFGVPYFPNATMGWDPSPRADQRDVYENVGYPFTNTIVGNTPERFRAALEIFKARLEQKKSGPRILVVNSWNEWTEGSYLEPDSVHGLGYLEAIRDVFGPRKP